MDDFIPENKRERISDWWERSDDAKDHTRLIINSHIKIHESSI